MGINFGLGLALREGARAAIRAAASCSCRAWATRSADSWRPAAPTRIGRAAPAYYIEGVNLADAKRLFKRSQRPGPGSFPSARPPQARCRTETRSPDGTSVPVKLSAIRAALAELQLTPSKTLGQNFLHDQNLARWIVAQLGARTGRRNSWKSVPAWARSTGAALETGARLTVARKRRGGWRISSARGSRARAVDGRARRRAGFRRARHSGAGAPGQGFRQPAILRFDAAAVSFHLAGMPGGTRRVPAPARTGRTPGRRRAGHEGLRHRQRHPRAAVAGANCCACLPASVFLPEPKVDSALISLTLAPAGRTARLRRADVRAASCGRVFRNAASNCGNCCADFWPDGSAPRMAGSRATSRRARKRSGARN